MAHQRVVADSDDDDVDDGHNDEDSLGPIGPAPRRRPSTPQLEPLSPLREPTSMTGVGSNSPLNHVSDSTSQSFFTSIYDEQHIKALQQSRLIENIVRQSQNVSGNSGGGGDMPLQVSSVEESSITPFKFQQPSGEPDWPTEGESDLTAHERRWPHDEWDVPSSEDEATPSKATRNRNDSRTPATHKKRPRTGPNSLTSLMVHRVQQASGSANAFEHAGYGLGDQEPWTQTTLPPSKRPRVSMHDTGGNAASNFYIAQSNMTTMQKLEYQKVSTPQIQNTDMNGHLVPQKSSGVTTIAYPTPSRYASSEPRLPWETQSTVVLDPDDDREVISIPSSPDIIAEEHYQHSPEQRDEIFPVTSKAQAEITTSSTDNSLTARKVREHAVVEEADELANDSEWGYNETAEHLEASVTKPTRRKRNAANMKQGDARASRMGQATDDNIDELALSRDTDTETQALKTEIQELQSRTDPSERPIKKQGRKKKQLIAVDDTEDEPLPSTEQPDIPKALVPLPEQAETASGMQTKKKKRGRPKKEDQAKAIKSIEILAADSKSVAPQENGNANQEPSPVETSERENEGKPENLDSESLKTPSPISPLKVKDPNTAMSPRLEAEPSICELKSVNRTAKSTLISKKEMPKPISLNSKTQYRVGLSRKSRVAPLLKIIKK